MIDPKLYFCVRFQSSSEFENQILELSESLLERPEFLGVDCGQIVPEVRILESALTRELPASSRTYSFYFSDRSVAEQSLGRLQALSIFNLEIVEEKAKDWDAEWRAHFSGVRISPFWCVRPTWQENSLKAEKNEIEILLNPASGFGTGTHETTQLCLESIGKQNLRGKRVLDFGTGSGILAVAAAKLGAEVDAIEIDLMALESAKELARMNGVEAKIRFSQYLPEKTQYDYVVANILKEVLQDFRLALQTRWSASPGSSFVLSGLLEDQVEDLQNLYESAGWQNFKSEKVLKGEWARLQWTA